MRSRPADDRPATTFVLLHGGRHGGWCWCRVGKLLREEGHEVFAPTFTGLGERAHLLNADIGLTTHVADLVGLLEAEELKNVTLVAHSYGGMVATGAMEAISHRVNQLVFLDAYMPHGGESMLDLADVEVARMTRELVARDGGGWLLPPGDPSVWGITDESDLAWVGRRITAHPLKCFEEPVGSTARAWQHPGGYIECRRGAGIHVPTDRPATRARDDERFQYLTIDAPHDAMIVAPELLTEALLEFAAVSASLSNRRIERSTDRR